MPERPPVPTEPALEEGQMWVWIKDHWEIRGTGFIIPKDPYSKDNWPKPRIPEGE